MLTQPGKNRVATYETIDPHIVFCDQIVEATIQSSSDPRIVKREIRTKEFIIGQHSVYIEAVYPVLGKVECAHPLRPHRASRKVEPPVQHTVHEGALTIQPHPLAQRIRQ